MSKPLGPCVLLACALTATLAGAQTPGRPLGRDEALRMAASKNLGVMVAALEVPRASAGASVARRAYVPELSIEASVTEVPGEPRRALHLTPALDYTSPYGTSLRVQGDVQEGLAANPDSTRALTIEVSQALLQSGFHTGAGAELTQADLDVEVARQRFRAELDAFLQRADAAYWDLAFATNDLEIRKRSRDRARDQFEETKENIRRGLLAEGEIFVVEASLADFEERLSRGEETLALSELALERLLSWSGPGAPIAASDVSVAAAPEVAEADAIAAALGKSPLVLAARLEAQRAEVGIGGHQRQTLPTLDVFGSAGVATGTDANAQPVSESPELRAGVRFAMPLYWGPDAARVERARIEQRQRKLDVDDAEEAARTAVREAAIRLRARTRRLEIASRLVELSQKKLEVEREKYKSGISTLADVVRFQRDLDGALSASLRARIDVIMARTGLAAARGDLSDSLGIRVQ